MTETHRSVDFEPTQPTDCDLRAGARVGDRYVVERWLGGGGFGCVYLARDLNVHGRKVVIKTLKAGAHGDAAVRKKFLQESEALARVNHDGVAKVSDVGQLPDGDPFFVMEYVQGRELRELIRPGGMPFAEVAALVTQICSALGSAHAEGVYHRDLKPENVVVMEDADGNLRAKVIDFGIAKVMNSVVTKDTGTARHWGTPQYMSPEQIEGKVATAATDVYALGVVAYELLTGQNPFDYVSPLEILRAKRDGVEEPLRKLRPELPTGTREVVLRALAYDPQKRYQSAAEFARALADSLSAPAATARRSSVAVILFGLILAALLVIGAVVWRWRTLPVTGRPGGGDAPADVGRERMAAADARKLTYHLTVQKVRDGQPFQQPFQSSGQEIFESGYKFRLHLVSRDAGYLYVFNEGPADDGRVYFNILYPTPLRNNGSARIEADQQVMTGENTFGGRADTEKFWIVWAEEEPSEIESAKRAAFAGEGKLRGRAEEEALRAFLRTRGADNPEVIKDIGNKQTVILGKGAVVVSLLHLEHR